MHLNASRQALWWSLFSATMLPFIVQASKSEQEHLDPNLLIYNRVPKSGSAMMRITLEEVAKGTNATFNNFRKDFVLLNRMEQVRMYKRVQFVGTEYNTG